jgi:hypothetical protein
MTATVTCTPSIKFVVCGHPPASAPTPESPLLELPDPLLPLDPEMPLDPPDPLLLVAVTPLEPPLPDPAMPLEPLGPPVLEPASSSARDPLSFGTLTCELLDPLLHAQTTAAAANRTIHFIASALSLRSSLRHDIEGQPTRDLMRCLMVPSCCN